MKKGSLTVFLSLSLTILISFSLFVTEIAIGNSQRIRFEAVTDMAMDSVMGEYSVALKERYGLLYVDTSYLEGAAEAVRVTDRFRVYFDANTTKVSEKKHAPWGRLLLQEAVLSSFETAAAQGGKSMQNQMIRYMERHPENGTEIVAAKEAVSAFSMQESSNALEAFCAVMEQIAGMEISPKRSAWNMMRRLRCIVTARILLIMLKTKGMQKVRLKVWRKVVPRGYSKGCVLWLQT